MADFLFPSAMKLGSRIGLSTVWNPEPSESSMPGKNHVFLVMLA